MKYFLFPEHSFLGEKQVKLSPQHVIYTLAVDLEENSHALHLLRLFDTVVYRSW